MVRSLHPALWKRLSKEITEEQLVQTLDFKTSLAPFSTPTIDKAFIILQQRRSSDDNFLEEYNVAHMDAMILRLLCPPLINPK